MENQPKFKTSKEIINYLAATFPHCFSTKGEAKPLKIGIFYDLVEKLGSDNDISKVKLRAALRTYTQSWRYLQSIKEGASRVDLDGLPGDPLTPEHIVHAQMLLKEGKERVKANKMAQHQENITLKKEKLQFVSAAKKRSSNCGPSTEKQQAVQHKKIQAQGRAKQELHAADIKSLKVGDEVKINLSSKPIKAILIAIEKENVRVKIQSGMELTVKSEYIVK